MLIPVYATILDLDFA